MSIWLLDGNMLLALTLVTHPHHQRADNWLARNSDSFIATCPVSEGTLLRIHMMHAVDTSVAAAWSRLRRIHAHPQHVFWPDNFSYMEIYHSRLMGHRQITDAWLAELARRNGGRVLTLDIGFAAAHPDAVSLAPVL